MDTLQRSDIKKLRVKVGDADRRGFSSEMQHEMDLARARLKASEHVQRLHVQMTTTCIDVPTLSEIIRYVKPPPLVHHVVMAMLLLMHQHEGKTRVSASQRYKQIQGVMGNGRYVVKKVLILGLWGFLRLESVPSNLCLSCVAT